MTEVSKGLNGIEYDEREEALEKANGDENRA